MDGAAVHQLALIVGAGRAEALAEQLADETDALAVSIEDADAGTADERPVFDEPGTGVRGSWQRARIVALYADEEAATRAAGHAMATVAPVPPAAIVATVANTTPAEIRVESISAVDEQDWVRTTQAQFAPVRFAADAWIVPTWHEVPEGARTVIRLDPGLGFGTGTHPTTRLVLGWIAEAAATRSAGWSRVLDYGCGSGILAIAAARHGAREVDAVDIDPDAVTAPRANAEANGVVLRAGLPALAHGTYPLVLANILAVPLKLLAPVLAGHVAPGGDLLLAGVLERQIAELQAAYAPWLALEPLAVDDGWVLLHGRRAGDG